MALHTTPARSQAGTSLIEILVTIVILTLGLLGLAGLQARTQLAQLDVFQRSQALILLDDMASRITANRTAAASYVTATPLGTGFTCATTSSSTRQAQDACEWSNALLGAAEEVSSTNNVGAMIGGRGCVSSLGSNKYMVTVAWQGKGPVSAPPTSVPCGQSLYNSATVCANDLCRRTLTTIVLIGTL